MYYLKFKTYVFGLPFIQFGTLKIWISWTHHVEKLDKNVIIQKSVTD